MRITSTSILFLFVLSLCSFSNEKKEANIGGTIKLEGTFFASGESSLSGLSVEVVNLHTNQLEDILFIKSKAKFDLKLGYKYMVYVKKKGFTTKKILVDARDAKRGSYKFEFDMELHHLDKDLSTTEFRPVCVLKYNRLKQKFEYDSDYTSMAKSDLRQEVYSKR